MKTFQFLRLDAFSYYTQMRGGVSYWTTFHKWNQRYKNRGK